MRKMERRVSCQCPLHARSGLAKLEHEGLSLPPPYQRSLVARRTTAAMTSGNVKGVLHICSPFASETEFDVRNPLLASVQDEQKDKRPPRPVAPIALQEDTSPRFITQTKVKKDCISQEAKEEMVGTQRRPQSSQSQNANAMCNLPPATWLTSTHLDLYLQDVWKGVKHSCVEVVWESLLLAAAAAAGWHWHLLRDQCIVNA